ncbi:MAG: cytidine deaminase [Bacteroidota bacterium]
MSKKILIKSEIKEYNSIEELSGQDKKLLDHARDAADLSYAPYSNFYVGAALLLENGKILKGNNQENVSYPSGLCAERVAIFAAGAQYPDTPIKAIAITAKSKKNKITEPVAPCGACRQVMAEYENRYQSNIRLILMGEVGKIYIIESVKNILPLMFNAEWLKK